MRRTTLLFLAAGCLGGAACPAQRPALRHPSGDGLRAEYFNGPNFEKKMATRIDPQIAFDWNWQYPAPGVQREYFSVRWTGKLYAPTSGRYRFSAVVDDGVRVWVGGKMVIDEWRKQDDIRFVGEVTLQARHWYDLRVEYYNDWKGSVISLNWEPPTDLARRPVGSESGPTPIPTDYFYSPARFAAVTAPAERRAGGLAPERSAVKAPISRPVARKRVVPSPQPARPAPEGSTPERAILAPVATEPFGQLDVGKTLTLKTVQFARSSYELLPQSFPELDDLVRALKANPAIRLEIVGHTDTAGDPRLNQSLSEHRAKVVVHYLARRGIDERRLEARGYGGTRPLVDGTTESERSKNRRVEMIVK